MSRFFICAIIFLFAFAPTQKKDCSAAPFYPASDTARVDSIVMHIDAVLADQKGNRCITRSFACEYSLDSGRVSVFYLGKKIILVAVHSCGDDHSSGEMTASFINGKLVKTKTTDYFWSFEDAAPGDTNCCPTYDQENSETGYFYDGKEILSVRNYQKVHNASGETESSAENVYYFDDSGEAADMKEIQSWIDFSNSKKSYADFFGEGK